MSTTLKTFSDTLGFTRFRGPGRKTCIQVTQVGQSKTTMNPLGVGYVQLTREEAGKMAELLEAFSRGEETEDPTAELELTL